jgi:large subunit ribosomal protein L5
LSTEKILEKWKENPMLRPKIEKVTVNMGVGKSGTSLRNAMKILHEISGQKPCQRRAKQTIRGFAIRKGEPIACLVTLRKKKAIDFLRKVFQAVDNKISRNNFDLCGNFSFGIKEHIELSGTKYVPELGIFGMNISVTVSRPGYRVKYKRRGKSKVGVDHKMTPDEAMVFVKDLTGVEIV